jgi:hypothetical protein
MGKILDDRSTDARKAPDRGMYVVAVVLGVLFGLGFFALTATGCCDTTNYYFWVAVVFAVAGLGALVGHVARSRSLPWKAVTLIMLCYLITAAWAVWYVAIRTTVRWNY